MLNILVIQALKVKHYQRTNITSSDILKTTTEPKSDMQCTMVCQKDIYCEGIIFTGMNCQLLKNVRIENGATELAWIDSKVLPLALGKCLTEIRIRGFYNKLFYLSVGCLDIGTDYWGNDLKHIPGISTAFVCQDLCQKESGCVGFGLFEGTCMLKSGEFWPLVNKRPYVGVISGPKYC